VLDVTPQRHVQNEEREGVLPAGPAWREGVDFDVIRSKVRQRRPAIIWSAVLGGVICAVLVGLYIFARTATYSATSEILIANTTLQLSGPDAFVTQLPIENSLVQSEMELARSDEVLERVIDGSGAAQVEGMLPTRNTPRFPVLGMFQRGEKQPESDGETRRQAAVGALRANVTVSRVGATLIIAVSAKAATAEAAARLTSEVVNAFVQDQTETNALITTASWLRERIKVLGPTLRVIRTAAIPSQPDGQHPFVVLALSMLTGMVLGTGAGLAFAVFDRRVVSAQQIAVITPAECFGYVPRLAARRGCGEVPAGGAPHGGQLSILNDVLRCARLAALQRAESDALFVGITSCQPGEGKSTIAMKLAQLMASEGRRVLLVDATNNSKLTGDFARGGGKGLTEVLRGEVSISEAIWQDVHPFLDFMPAGAGGSDIDARWPEFPHLLSNVDQRIVLDLPAITTIADVRAAVQAVNGILLVVEWGRTSERRLREALRALGPASHKLLGVIINQAPKHVFRENAFPHVVFGHPVAAAQIRRRETSAVSQGMTGMRGRLFWRYAALRSRNSRAVTEYRPGVADRLEGEVQEGPDLGR
jgi:Mrp family chromosome partitioning ATPase/capsular polysaccharide biosynthesis protein